MAESVTRKACDRCHSQKLSCKRPVQAVKGAACERCARLNADCTYSPSLRYRKQHQQHQQQQQQELSRQEELPPTQGRAHMLDEAPGAFEQGSDTKGQPPETYQQGPRPSLGDRRVVDTMSGLVQPDGSDSQRGYFTPGSLYPLSGFDFVVNQGDRFQQQHGFEGIESSLGSEYLSQQIFTSNADDSILLHSHHQQNQHQISHPRSLSVGGVPWSGQHHYQHLTAACPDIGVPHRVAQPTSLLAIAQQKEDQEQLPPHLVPPPLRRRSRGPSHRSASPGKIARRKGRRDQAKESRLRRAAALTAATTSSCAKAGSKAPASPSSFSLAHIQGNDLIALMAKLSTIQSRLLELEGMLPKDMDSLIGQRGKAAASAGFPVKDMFRLTQDVTDILHNLTHAGVGGATTASSCDNPHRVATNDPASSLFILSIYIRLLDVYGKIFALISAEVARAADATSCNNNADDADDAPCFQFWTLPDMKMEDFSLCATPYLHMGLTLRVTEQLLAKLRAATLGLYEDRDDTAENQGDGGEFDGIVCVSYQGLRKTEDDLKKRLTELREEIELTYE